MWSCSVKLAVCVVTVLMAFHFKIMPTCNPPKCMKISRLSSECLSFKERQAKYLSMGSKLSLKYTCLDGWEKYWSYRKIKGDRHECIKVVQAQLVHRLAYEIILKKICGCIDAEQSLFVQTWALVKTEDSTWPEPAENIPVHATSSFFF